ncbi:MAG: oligosaccharide flippase family protein [Desulfovibrionaceae bacterium]|nr:oligosaccharide flippase family protein [Desulfovibrionaceae bacterium]
MKLKSIPRRLGYILGAQWTRDVSWTVFTMLLARHSPTVMGQIVLALSFGYLVKTAADVGLNEFLLSTFARGQTRPRALLGEVSWLKIAMLLAALGITWLFTGWQQYTPELRLIVLAIAAGLGMDAVCDSFFALCQARGRQDVEMRIRVPAALLGFGVGITCILLDAPPICIALYKPIESVCCLLFALKALGRNPLVGVGLKGMVDLARHMKSGLIFTAMSACSMAYNKINVIFLKDHGTDADVGRYGIAWEAVEGISVLISSALLGKVIFPLLTRLWQQDRVEFRRLAGQTARSLWAGSLPVIFIICVEGDRILPLIYGSHYLSAVPSLQLLTPCLATAFLHNLAAYAMIGMGHHKLLLAFYASGLLVNLVCCFTLIPIMPLEGTALTLTITKVWVAILTVSFFQYMTRPMSLAQWSLMLLTAAGSVALWYGLSGHVARELAELAGLVPLLVLFWFWRPPAPFERKNAA